MNEKNGLVSVSISTGTMVRAVLVALFFFLLWYLQNIVLVIMTAIVLASFVESAVPYFKKIRVGRVAGVIILYAVSLLALAAMFYIFTPVLITEVYNLSLFLASYAPGINFLDFFQGEAFVGVKDIVVNMPNGFSLSALLAASQSFIGNLSGGFFSTLSVVFGGVFNVVLILVISFYLSIQKNGIQNFLRTVLPVTYEEYAVDLWERSRKKIALWLKGQMFLGLIVAVLVYLVLSILGIQYALLLAIMTGLLEMIPYGMWVAIIPAVSFSYLSGGITGASLVFISYVIIHQFENFIFAPLIVKRVVGLSPLTVIISILIGYELAGFWGLILAIPTAVFLMELVNDFEKRKINKREALAKQ